MHIRTPTPAPESTTLGGVRGRTLYYSFHDYLKLGMYRSPDIPYESTIYLDELRCGPTRESVALPPMEEAVTRVGGGEGASAGGSNKSK